MTIAGWTLDVDLATTRDYYSERRTWSDTCGCTYCRNFVMAYRTGHMSEAVVTLLESLGVDLSKSVGEVYQFDENADGTHSYGGFYHVAGTIISAPHDSDAESYHGDILVSFSPELDLVAANFPRPAIQVEFTVNVPWVLPEPPES